MDDRETASRIARLPSRRIAYRHYLEREVRYRPNLEGQRRSLDGGFDFARKQVGKREQIEPDKIMRIVRIQP